jgi:mRNA-degrading endonuclease RelE of RelBE toxin-antitoxin system
VERTSADSYGSPNLSLLRGELSGLHRLRVGDCGVVIEFNDGQNCLYVHAIGPRGDIYK